MDDEAVHTRLTHTSIAPYFREHVDEWFEQISDAVSAMLTPEDIILVTGHVKASQWSLMVFECDTTLTRNVTEVILGGITFSFSHTLRTFERHNTEFAPVIRRINKSLPDADQVVSTSWADGSLWPVPTSYANSPAAGPWPHDNCVFLDVIRAKRRLFGLPRKISAAAYPKRDPRHGYGDDHAGVLSAQDQPQEASSVSGALL